MKEDRNPETLADQRTPPVIAIDSEISLCVIFSHLGFHVIFCVCVGFSVIWLYSLHYIGAWINSLGNYSHDTF